MTIYMVVDGDNIHFVKARTPNNARNLLCNELSESEDIEIIALAMPFEHETEGIYSVYGQEYC